MLRVDLISKYLVGFDDNRIEYTLYTRKLLGEFSAELVSRVSALIESLPQ